MEPTNLKVVQVGCGGMGRGWIEAGKKTDGLELVGLVDLHRPTAEAAAAKFDLPPSVVFDSLASAIEKTNPDVVFDVTIPASHESVVTEALRAGRHVLGEKPMSETLDSAKRMVAAAAAADRTYAVTQNYRFNPTIRGIKSFLTAGHIGPVQECHADFFIAPHFGGFRDEMAFPLLLDMSIHTFDAARFLTGADPVSVYCHSFNPGRSWYKGDASAVVIFEMSNGIVFSYRGSWCSEGLSTDWNSSWRLIGSKGSIQWDGGAGLKAQTTNPAGEKKFLRDPIELTVPIEPISATSHVGVMREFVDALKQNRRPETDCRDNIKSLAMVFAAVESAKSGAKLAVEY